MTYVSIAPVPRGRSFEVAVVAQIRTGFHMNSNKPSEDFLIPTTLTADLSSGLRLVSAAYPPGVMRKFKFSAKELSVYEGSVTLRMKFQAASNAPIGAMKIPLALRYQACNEEACLPPMKLPLNEEITIAPAGAKSQPQHPEVFTAVPAKK